MPGRGPAPKSPGERRRYGQPSRSEWVELEELAEPVLPAEKRAWGANARRMWRAWSRDPVTSQWAPADIAFAMELCRLYDKLPYHEQRLRMESLGLSPKGRRDLRWRTATEAKTLADQAPVKRLRLTEAEKQAA